jgi:hypothetical protein
MAEQTATRRCNKPLQKGHDAREEKQQTSPLGHFLPLSRLPLTTSPFLSIPSVASQSPLSLVTDNSESRTTLSEKRAEGE